MSGEYLLGHTPSAETRAKMSASGRGNQNALRHGHSRRSEGLTPEYRAYHKAKNRCENPRCDKYAYYGGRVPPVLFLFASLEQWLAELGPRPSAGHSVDRIDNDGHYEIGNVRWATPKQQAQNRRKRKDAK